MKTILLTGGAGFVGSHIASKLVSMGHKVIIYDSFIQYISPLKSNYQKYLKIRFKNIEDKVRVIRGDTRDLANLKRVLNEYKPSHIVHLAALPLADISNNNSEEALNSILNGTVNVLEIIRDQDFYFDRFLYISSSMIYGDFQTFPCPEIHPKTPKDIYGGTKYAGEVLVETFGRRYGIDYTIVRPSAVYGPTDVNKRVSQIFIENAFLNKPITLFNDGKPVLDFTFVEDVADGIILALLSEKSKNEAFNITYGVGYTLLEFAESLQRYFPTLEIVKKSKMDVFRPKRGALDITKAKKLLGYNPKFNLDDGVDKYINFIESNNIFK